MSVSEISKVRLPLADAFFRNAVSTRRLAHAYLLKGRALGAMYNLALQVARVVNCETPPAGEAGDLSGLACGQCRNCRWISENAHPAVQTVSPLTALVDDDRTPPEPMSAEALEKIAQKSAWPTQIKTGQMEYLIGRLGVSSEYTRVVILADAEELPATIPSETPPPCEWASLAATQERSFHIRPLHHGVFNAFSVNRFLKTLEEPPPRTLFFLLAENEGQVLETVVSRCQVVPCVDPEGLLEEPLPEGVDPFFHDFAARLRENGDAYALRATLESFMQEQGLSLTQVLVFFQRYLRQAFRQGGGDDLGGRARFDAYRTSQREIETTLRMLAAKTHETSCALHLILKLGGPLQALYREVSS